MKRMKVKKVNDKVHQIIQYGRIFFRRIDVKEISGVDKCVKCDFKDNCDNAITYSWVWAFRDGCKNDFENKGKVLKRCNIKIIKIGLIERIKQFFN